MSRHTGVYSQSPSFFTLTGAEIVSVMA